jgi:hypothetical protein
MVAGANTNALRTTTSSLTLGTPCKPHRHICDKIWCPQLTLTLLDNTRVEYLVAIGLGKLAPAITAGFASKISTSPLWLSIFEYPQGCASTFSLETLN